MVDIGCTKKEDGNEILVHRHGKDATAWSAGLPSPAQAASCSGKCTPRAQIAASSSPDTGFPAAGAKAAASSGRRNSSSRRGLKDSSRATASWGARRQPIPSSHVPREHAMPRAENSTGSPRPGASIAYLTPTTCWRAASERRVAPRRGATAGVGVARCSSASSSGAGHRHLGVAEKLKKLAALGWTSASERNGGFEKNVMDATGGKGATSW